MSKDINKCLVCEDRLNYVKLCEKYDQLESVHEVLVADNLTYEEQITDLEAKLAEKEKENELMAKTLKMTKFIEKEVNQDKISFCIDKLEKVKDYAQHIQGGLINYIDNQIKQLKTDKNV